MQTSMKIYSVLLKLNHFLPSAFLKRTYKLYFSDALNIFNHKDYLIFQNNDSLFSMNIELRKVFASIHK